MAIDSIGVGGFVPFVSDPARAAHPGIEEEGGKSFGQFLSEALGDVNALQQNAGKMVQGFATGERMDVHQVMIALEQAGTALALTVQVRNKLLDAYQEIMRTQV